MNKIFLLLYLNCLLGIVGFAQGSVVLDLSKGDGTKAFVLPRVATTASIVTPINGMLVYDISSNCTKVFDNGLWSNCLGQPSSGAGVNCAASGINGNYNQGSALSAANTVTIVIINNTNSALTITNATTDIALSGTAAAGMSVATVSPASVSPGVGGGSSTITYTLNGTPSAAGAFTTTFTKLGLSCVITGNVCGLIAPIVVSNTTNPATLPTPVVAGNTLDFTAAGGTPNTGLTWSMSSNPVTGVFSSPATGTGAAAQAILVANASGLVTVTFTAVNACGVTVTGTQGVGVRDLSVNNSASAINGIYTQNTALTAANTVTVVLVNNSTNAKTITPLTSDIVLSGVGAAGITVASFSPASVPVAANGGTSTITYTLSGTPSAVGSFTATWTKVGLSLVKTSAVCYAITPIVVSNTTTPLNLPSPAVAGNTVNFTAAGGTPNTGMNWVMTSYPATGVFSNSASGTGNTAQAVIVAGASNYSVTVTFTAVNACGLMVTGTQTFTLDALGSALVAAGCASCTAYNAAAADSWVQITAAEYAQIDNYVPVNIAACNETIMSMNPGGADGNAYTYVVGGANTQQLPANNYVVGFSAIKNSTSSSIGMFLKYSNSPTSGFNTIGPILVIPPVAGRIYNIMKKPSMVMNPSYALYVGIYTEASTITFTTQTASGSNYGYVMGNSSATTATNGANQAIQYQVKGTASKKW